MMEGLKVKINDSLEYNLKHVEWEEVGDVLVIIEQSFNISFEDQDFINLKTFGDLCDLVHDKIVLEHRDDCTSQQAFYKLKKALAATFDVDQKNIVPGTLLSEIIPYKYRIDKVKVLEQKLEMKLMLLSPPVWLSVGLLILLGFSFLAFFLSWKIAVAGLAFSFAGFWISAKLGKEIEVLTVGDLVSKITSEHYLKSRSISNTINRNELEGAIRSLFIEHLGLDSGQLDREAGFKDF